MFPEFSLLYLLGPALGLGLWAQLLVRSGWAAAGQQEARMSGYAAARHVLDGAGLYKVTIEQVPGHMSDHFEPADQSLRLSSQVYHGRSLASIGFAAHEAGHALQQATGFRPLMIRHLAVPAASFGSGAGILAAGLGLLLGVPQLLSLGVFWFTAMVAVQVVNLLIEWDASCRARRSLLNLEIIDDQQVPLVQKALRAAALTLLAGTLQSVFTLVQQIVGIFRPRPAR